MLSTEISVTLFREPKRAGTHAGHLAAAWQTWRQASPPTKGQTTMTERGCAVTKKKRRSCRSTTVDNRSRRLRVLTDSALFVVDDVGYQLPVSQDGAVLFVQLVNAWHGQARPGRDRT